MRIQHFIIVLCCILFATCTRHPEFTRTETITQELMPLQGITYPFGLDVKHPFLIVENLKRIDSIFHIYDLNNYELKSTFGTIGQAPCEFVSPALVSTHFSDFFIEGGDDKAYQFGINQEGIPIFKKIRQSNYVESVTNAAFINDSLYVLDAMFISPGFIHLLSFEDKLPKKSWKYGDPSLLDRFIDPNLGKVYANDSRVVFAYNFKKQIDFMDIDFNPINRVKFKYTYPSSITRQNLRETKQSYTSGYLGKHYFYALFRGAIWDDYKETSFCKSVLEVFDLDGNPIIKYHLDGIAPTAFVVDEKTFTLYGRRDDNEPEDYLLVYRLKGLQ